MQKTAENGSHSTLSGKQEKAIAALLSEPTIGKAAAVVGCSERSLHAWLKLPAFDEEYRQARIAALEQALGRLQQLTSGAVTVLATIADDENAPAGTRVVAARTIIDMALRGVELEVFEARLAAVESALEVRSEGDDDRTLDAL